MPVKGAKLVDGEPLPPEEELRAWVMDTVPEERVDFVMHVVDQVFYHVDASVVTETSLERFDEPKDVRSALWNLYDMGAVRTYTIRTPNNQGRSWKYFHYVLSFPGQEIQERDY